MACASCAKKQQYASTLVASRSLTPPEYENLDECHFTKEEIESKRDELVALKETTTKSKLTRLTYNIYLLNRALKYYDSNCNKYLKDLYGLIPVSNP